jgi:hypothetical protein
MLYTARFFYSDVQFIQRNVVAKAVFLTLSRVLLLCALFFTLRKLRP